MRKFISFIRRLKEKVTNIIRWLPIIWNDHQWDHVFFYVIIRHKLKLMEQFFRSEYALSVKANKEAEKIKKCILVLDRLINNDYYVVSGGEKVDKKYGELNMKFLPVKDTDYSEIKIYNKKCETEEEEKLALEARKKCYLKEDELEKQDLDYLFSNLRKHIQCWWD